MTREEKNQAITELQELLQDSNVVYLTDASSLNSADTTKLRGECYKAEIKLQVVKNTLLRIAMESIAMRSSVFFTTCDLISAL